jgi:ADP-ribose pyrophosphatase
MARDPAALEVLASTPYLELVRRDGWSYVRRPNASAVVGVLAITDDGRVVLIEQHRTPVNARVIELPAGLVGDTPGQSLDPLEAARRELLEETGYHARDVVHLADGPSSAGLTDEVVKLYLARGLEKQGAGGVEGESIEVMEVPLDEVDRFCADRARAGRLIDFKIAAALQLARLRT